MRGRHDRMDVRPAKYQKQPLSTRNMEFPTHASSGTATQRHRRLGIPKSARVRSNVLVTSEHEVSGDLVTHGPGVGPVGRGGQAV